MSPTRTVTRSCAMICQKPKSCWLSRHAPRDFRATCSLIGDVIRYAIAPWLYLNILRATPQRVECEKARSAMAQSARAAPAICLCGARSEAR